MPTVALVRCADYAPEAVDAAVRRSISLLGGMAAFVRPGQRVLLKPNLVRPMAPDKAATTHPQVVAAVARLVREAGGEPVLVESPGGPYLPAILRNLYRRTGMEEIAAACGLALNEDVSTAEVPHPEAVALHRLDLVAPALSADVIINLAKLKTHNLTGLTLAVKNLFGLVPGALKIGYHARLRDRDRFGHGMVDIYTYVRPALNLIDAVVGMEGEGPSGGDARPIGALVASADALAADVAAAALVGMDPLGVLTTRVAAERGLTTGRLEDLTLLGDPLDTLRISNFRRGSEAKTDPGLLPAFVRRVLRPVLPPGNPEDGRRGLGLVALAANTWVWHQVVTYPAAGPRCTGCGFCARHCPVDAITVVDGAAVMDRERCIRCYCCHELCPELAVELRRPWLGRLLLRR